MFSILTRMVGTIRLIHFVQIYLNCTYVTAQIFSTVPEKDEKGSSWVEVTSVYCDWVADSPRVRGFQCPNCAKQGSWPTFSGERERRGVGCVVERPSLSWLWSSGNSFMLTGKFTEGSRQQTLLDDIRSSGHLLCGSLMAL